MSKLHLVVGGRSLCGRRVGVVAYNNGVEPSEVKAALMRWRRKGEVCRDCWSYLVPSHYPYIGFAYSMGRKR